MKIFHNVFIPSFRLLIKNLYYLSSLVNVISLACLVIFSEESLN